MDIEVSFPGGSRVDARFGTHVVETDQGGSAPSPFELFLASLATCAGYYALAFCRTRRISMEGIRIVQRDRRDEQGIIQALDIVVVVPSSFPEAQRAAIARAASACKVKKTVAAMPSIVVRTCVDMPCEAA
jgi:ribosomal protein S12 methylthiotransferase accessory factor